MIPRISKTGRSFKGAALYYLHDKGAQTSDRVSFVETVNLPTNDARKAIAHMIDTAVHAGELKKAAGLKAGRNLQKPVYVYSLAWHPTEKPSMAHQVEAARETIAALGLSNRQAMIVAHNDTDHPHVHVLVNRVCPETGKAATMSKDQLILSRWAQEYEKRHGKVHCQARIENNAERDRRQWRKDNSPNRKQWLEWKKQTSAALWQEYRDERDAAKGHRKPQYDALWQQRQERMNARKEEIKLAYKPLWRDLYKRQRKEQRAFDNRFGFRLSFALSVAGLSTGKAIIQALTNDRKLRRTFLQKQEAEKSVLSGKHLGAIRDAGREITKAWKFDRDELRKSHKAEDTKRLDHYRTVTDQVWQKKAVEQRDELSQAQEQRERPKRSRKRQSIHDRIAANTSPEHLKEAEEEARKEAEREMQRRDRDPGRTFDR